MGRKLMDCIGSFRDIEKKCHKHMFWAKPGEASHENFYKFSYEVTPYVMRWQETLYELDPHARLQVGMSVYYLTEKVEYPANLRMDFLSKREYEKSLSHRAYEELEPREYFENEKDFQREMVAAWQKVCFIGVPGCYRKIELPLLGMVSLKVHHEVEKLSFMKYAKL